MKRLRIFSVLLACFSLLHSCTRKSSQVITQPGPLPLLRDLPFLYTAPYGMMGTLQAVQKKFISINGTDTTIHTHDIAYANFAGGNGNTLANAGVVTLNNFAVPVIKYPGGDSFYYYTEIYDTAFPHSLNMDTATWWQVTGNNNIPRFSCDYKGTFPDYSGSLPLNIDKSAGFTVASDAFTVTGSDSLIIIVSDSMNNVVYKQASASAGVVTFSPPELSSLTGATTHSTLVGWMKVIVYQYTVQAISSMKFVFVKEKEVWQAVNIY